MKEKLREKSSEVGLEVNVDAVEDSSRGTNRCTSQRSGGGCVVEKELCQSKWIEGPVV